METRTFTSESFGMIRTVIINGEIWFCGLDVTRALKCEFPRNVLKTVCTPFRKDLRYVFCTQPVRERLWSDEASPYPKVMISEHGICQLAFGSPKHTDEKFAAEYILWIKNVIVPAFSSDDFYAREVYARSCQEYEARIQVLRDKVIKFKVKWHEAVAAKNAAMEQVRSKNQEIKELTERVKMLENRLAIGARNAEPKNVKIEVQGVQVQVTV